MDNLKQKLIGLLVGFEIALFGCVYFMELGLTLKPEEGKTKNLILGIITLIIILAILGYTFYLTKHILLPNKFKEPSEGANDLLNAFKGITKNNNRDDIGNEVDQTRRRKTSAPLGEERPPLNKNRQRPVQTRNTVHRNVNGINEERRPASHGRKPTNRPRPTSMDEVGRPTPRSRQRTNESGRVPSSRPRPTANGESRRPIADGESRRPTTSGRPSTTGRPPASSRPRSPEAPRRPRPTSNGSTGRPRPTSNGPTGRPRP